jgi:RNA polymerase sigma-70 factor (ECF subfamily)
MSSLLDSSAVSCAQSVSAVPDGIDGHPANEEAGLAEAARTNAAAFTQLYQQYVERVYAYVRTRTRTEADAADLTQQVFLRALDGLSRYRGKDPSFAAWLFRIARNTVADFHRRQRCTVAWDLVPEALQPQMEHDVDAELIRDEAITRLRTLFDALDPETRELLVLRFGAGLGVTEIAAVIGKSEAATRKRLYRTIQTLKEQYHDDAR